MSRLPRLALLSLLALTACPGSSGKDGGQPPVDSGQPDAGHDAGKPDSGVKDAGPPDAGWQNVTVEDWCKDLATAQCWRDERCLAIDSTQLDYCLTRYEATCDQLAYTRAVKEGRLQFLSQKADDCLNALDRGSCTELDPACAVVFSGLVPPDGGCIVAEECDPSGFCYQYDYTCPHRCRPYLPLGAPCLWYSSADRCRPGEAWCGSLDGGADTCLAPLADGQPCDYWNNPCRQGSFCVTDDQGLNGHCVKSTAGPGEACGFDTNSSLYPQCGTDYFCRQDLALMPPQPGTCQRKGGLGEQCNGLVDMLYRPIAPCLPSLHCSSTYSTGTCVGRAKVGDPCSNYLDCEEGLYCDPPTSKCALPPGDGGDCSSAGSSGRCLLGYYCDYSQPQGRYKCWPLPANGEPCSYYGECLSNDCDYGALPDGGNVCIPECAQRADGGF